MDDELPDDVDGLDDLQYEDPDDAPEAEPAQPAASPVRTATFVHLHNHTEFSPLDGMGRLADMAKAAAADGQPALAITDHGTLGGVYKFVQAAKAAGVKPILGIEAYLAIGNRLGEEFLSVPADEESGDDDETDKPAVGQMGEIRTKRRRYEHLTVLATSKVGWRNLVWMHNQSQESFWGKPRIDFDLLAQARRNGGGLIVMTGCVGGPVAGPLSRGDEATARLNLAKLVEHVGAENVYVEVMDHSIPAQHEVAPKLVALAREMGLKLVATNDAHYTQGEDAQAHEAWLAVGTKARLSDANRFKFHGTGHHVRTEEEMRACFGGADWWQEACDTTVEIADRVEDDVLPPSRLHLPVFDVARVEPTFAPAGVNRDDPAAMSRAYLKHLVSIGARRRLGLPPDARLKEVRPDVNARIAHEYKVICDLGFADYFLIMRDVIEWCRSDRGLPTDQYPLGVPGKKVPIRTGPGRGSAAGSLVSWCLGIVRPNPLDNGLLFERFLDPERAGMPDIDTDFEQGRRQEVIAYLAARWGADRVANIGAFGVCRTRAALRDAARVLGLPQIGDHLAPKVPIEAGKPAMFAALLDPSNVVTADFRAALEGLGEDGARVVDLARRFENVTKTPSIHASGIIICDEPLDRLVPLRKNRAKNAPAGGPWIVEWDGVDCEAFGLLKLDILGLRNLDIVSETVRFIEQHKGERVEPDDLDPDDGSERSKRTWALLREGKTSSVFQMESQGMTELAMDAGPDRLEDLSAIVALYRPGPMGAGMHHRWAKRKRGVEEVDYTIFTTDPVEQAALASVLDESLGIPVYQEQAMRLGEVICGFSAVEKNRLRKAISKKKQAEIDAIYELWMAGAPVEKRDAAGAVLSPVFSATSAQAVWDAIKEAASYSFNKSHSVAYGWLAYETAYLKANWPTEYAAAVLSVTRDKADKRLAAIASLREEGIALFGPDVNSSRIGTFPTEEGVRLGLSEIRGVGSNAAAILAERDARGPFATVGDLVDRVRVRKGEKDSALPVNIVEALIEAGACDSTGETRRGLMTVVRALSHDKDTPVLDFEWGLLERATRERSRLGVVVGQHPMLALAEQMKRELDPAHNPLKGTHHVAKAANDQRISVAGILVGWTERPYGARSGRPGKLARVLIEGSRGVVSAVMFDAARSELGFVPVVGQVVGVRGRVQLRVRDVEDSNGNIREVQEREMLLDSLWVIDPHDPVAETVEPAQELRDRVAAWPAPVPLRTPFLHAEDADTLTGAAATQLEPAENETVAKALSLPSSPLLASDGEQRGVWLLLGPARPVLVQVGCGADLDALADSATAWVINHAEADLTQPLRWEPAPLTVQVDDEAADAAHVAA